MPPLPVGQNHHARASLANHARNFEAILPSVFDASIRNVERSPPNRAKDFCRIRRLTRALFRCAASSHLALREIENADALPALRGPQQSASAGLLYVVAVSGDGHNVKR